MSEDLCLAPLLESYFRRRLAKQCNATPATMASYRDALRMLILVAAGRLGKEPVALMLEEKRNNSVATRNARLAAVRSFFHHVAAADPAAFGIAQRVLAIPTKRAHIEVTHHLTNAEVEAIIATPDQTTRRDRRDRALLLFSARTGPACPKRSAPTRVIFACSDGVRRCCFTARGAEIVSFPFLGIWCNH